MAKYFAIAVVPLRCWSSVAKFIMASLLAFTLPGCGHATMKFPIELMPNELRLETYAHGKLISVERLEVGDERLAALRLLLINHLEGWSVDRQSYAPSLYFVSEAIRINCMNNSIVANYRKHNSESWIQIGISGIPCHDAIARR